MPIDTSMYSTVPGPAAAGPPNLLGAVGQFADTQNKLNQNALFQQEFNARKALGPIMQQSIGPDGQIDYGKASVLLSTHPEAAWKAPEIINGWVQRQNTQADTVLKALKSTQDQLGIYANVGAGLVEKGHSAGSIPGTPDAISEKDMVSSASQLIADGMDPKEVLKHLTQWKAAATGPDGRFDPKKAYQVVLQSTLTGAGAANSLDRTFKAVSDSVGGGVRKSTENTIRGTNTPMTGTPQAGGLVPNVPTVGELSTTRKVVGPQGQQQEVPAGSIPGAVQTLGSPTGGGPPPLGGGAASGATPVQTQSIAAPTGATQSSLGPYKSEALKEIATKYEPELNTRADSATRLLNLISESKELMRDFTPNAAQDVRARMAAFLKAANVSPDIVKRVAGGDVGSVQAFDKLAVQGATEAMAQLFRGSGSKFTQEEWRRFQSAYPAVKTDPGAIGKMYDFMSYMAHNAQLEQKYFNLHKDNSNYDLTKWPSKWQETAQEIAKNYWKARLPPSRAEGVLKEQESAGGVR